MILDWPHSCGKDVPSIEKKESDFLSVKELFLSNGFACRGKAFFRVVGDGVLQVSKFERYRSRENPVISIGLFSLYGELLDQWVQSRGCIPRYVFYNLFLEDSPDFLSMISGQTIQRQLVVLKEEGIPWLDSIVDQKRLANGICELDISQSKKVCWNDGLKIAPFLASNQLENCQKVLRAILDQHHDATLSRRSYMNAEEFQAYQQEIAKGDEELFAILHMVEAKDTKGIYDYLQRNYLINMKKVAFCVTGEGLQRQDAKTD